jgi:hypothetical protein
MTAPKPGLEKPLPVCWSGPPTRADVLHLAFVPNNALGSPACFQRHRRLPVGDLASPNRPANASASSGLPKQNTTKSLSSRRREYVSCAADRAAARQHHRREPPGNLSACSIQLGTAVAPGLPQRLQRIRGPKDGTAASSGQSSILTARSWPQSLAGHEQATEPVPAHAAERHRADWFLIPGHLTS